MGHGRWTRESFERYSVSRGRTVSSDGSLSGSYKAQDMFVGRSLAPELNPYNVVRECCDTQEHPNSIPVILALDVTGSMGSAAVEVAKKLNTVMTDLYTKVEDIEFMIMGIGDLAYDRAPIQVSQYESDIRIAEQLDKIYFEGGGGGNGYESYTAAWYFALHHTKLDCHKRGKKGVIITMGDEPLNPYLPYRPLAQATGDNLEADVETNALYKAVTEKFEVYHLFVKHAAYGYDEQINKTFGKYLDSDHFRTVNIDSISGEIVNILTNLNLDAKKGFHLFGKGISW